jgi:hypothetical protein
MGAWDNDWYRTRHKPGSCLPAKTIHKQDSIISLVFRLIDARLQLGAEVEGLVMQTAF